MSMFGQVYAQNKQYKIKGDFHHLTPNRPIRDADDGWKLLGVTNPRDMTYIHSYGGEAVFFESLGRGKLMATRCDNPHCEGQGTIYQPFRTYCMDCLEKCTVINMTDLARATATVHTFMVCERSGAFNILTTPIKFINVEFDGVGTILMGYLSVGEPEIGMRVLPIFQTLNPTCTILDLSWVPAGTKESELPEGFTF